jgi:hypothetical protein
VFDVAATRTPGVDQLRQQAGHQHRVAGVVQLELVDGEQPVPRQRLDGLREAERADQVGQLDEGAVALRLGGLVPQRGEQVRLADAEAAVEVDAGPSLRRPRPPEQPLRHGLQPGRELLQRLHGSGLRRLVRIGPVGGEADGVEARRRHHRGHQRLGGHDRLTVDEARGRHDERA